MQKYTRDEITEVVLSTLLVVGILTTAVLAPNAVQLFKYFGPKNARERWKIKRSMGNIERKGFIKRVSSKEGDRFSLTPTGKRRAQQYQLRDLKIAPQRKWDGLWRIIMFDVPEEKRPIRKAISRTIKRIGCVQYQKSVFITPYPCEQEVDFLGEALDARKYICVIVAQKIEHETRAKKFFCLH